MEAINTLLVGTLGPMGPVIAVGGMGIVLLLVAIPLLMSGREDPMKKLQQQQRDGANSKLKTVLRDNARNEKLNKYAQFLEPQDERELAGIRLRLLQAGYRQRDAVRYFYFAQFALGVGLLIAGVSYFLLFVDQDAATTQQKLMYILGPGGLGYMFPKYWVTRRVEARKEEIISGFPDSLDMMLVCVEAGQSLDQSIVRVAGELRASYPALADEFSIVSHEMKAGKDKGAVLGDMSERCGVQDVSSFVTVLIQSQTFGTSISDALRIYASEMRDKRVMRAEEKANQLPTKMTLTTMMLTVPPLLIILVGPSVVGITEMGNIGQ